RANRGRTGGDDRGFQPQPVGDEHHLVAETGVVGGERALVVGFAAENGDFHGGGQRWRIRGRAQAPLHSARIPAWSKRMRRISAIESGWSYAPWLSGTMSSDWAPSRCELE